MTIALAGNPNSGKTSLFNALSGRGESTGNWPGVTVGLLEAPLRPEFARPGAQVKLVDLPGCYSLCAYSGEEAMSRQFLLEEKPDLVVNVVDAQNLSRSLFLSLQLVEEGLPLVVALNKSDLARAQGIRIDSGELSKQLGCPVVETVANGSRNSGVRQLVGLAVPATAPASCCEGAVGAGADESHKIKNEIGPGCGAQSHPAGCEFREAAKERYARVGQIVNGVERRSADASRQTRQDRADKVLTHPLFGLPIFAVIMFCIFSVSQAWVGPFLADFLVGGIDAFYGFVEGLLGEGVNPVLSALLLDGIIGGVGAVIGFLPLIMVLFFLLALLEDSGYMARVAVLMDRYFRKIGLSGKSIIPMIVSTGCAIPGIMASRTIRCPRQRRTTAMLASYMPCGAKLPLIALFAGVFFGNQAWVGTSMYFLAIVLIALSGLLIRWITKDRSSPYFILELPEYRAPSLKKALVSMFSRAWGFIANAATIILVCNAVVHLLSSFDMNLQLVGSAAATGALAAAAANPASQSILATIAGPLAVLFIPLGFGVWQFAAAAVTGFIAKENVVGTLAVSFAATSLIDIEEFALLASGAELLPVFGISAAAGLACLIFNLFTPPCFAAIGAMRTEMGSRAWLWGAVGFQLSMGYTLAFFAYQLGTLISEGQLGQGFLPGLVFVLCFMLALISIARRNRRGPALALVQQDAG